MSDAGDFIDLVLQRESSWSRAEESEARHGRAFERRLAAVVLLQSSVRLLTNTELTRIEGFIRSARLKALVDPIAIDVVGPSSRDSTSSEGSARTASWIGGCGILTAGCAAPPCWPGIGQSWKSDLPYRAGRIRWLPGRRSTTA